jgi:hypothetical protein
MAAATDSDVTAVKDKQTSQADPATTPCMPCSFGPRVFRRSEACAQWNGPPEVTVTNRSVPLVTAAYGTQMARPARTMMLVRGGDGTPLGPRVRRVLGDDCVVGKPRRRGGSQASTARPLAADVVPDTERICGS